MLLKKKKNHANLVVSTAADFNINVLDWWFRISNLCSVARTGEFKFLKICVHWIFRFSWYMGLVCGCSKDCIPMVRFVPQDQQCEKDYFGVWISGLCWEGTFHTVFLSDT